MLIVDIMNYIRDWIYSQNTYDHIIYRRFTVGKSSSKHLCNTFNPFIMTNKSTNHTTSISNNNWCDQVGPKSPIKGKPLHSPLLTSTECVWGVKRAPQPLHCLATSHTVSGLPHLMLNWCDTRCIHIITDKQPLMHSNSNKIRDTISTTHDEGTDKIAHL